MNALLIIDPQRDFTCADGSLFVPGADEDMERLARFVGEHSTELDAIFVTMDSHRTMHIAHPAFWQDAEGCHPEPFTVITHEDVVCGRWHATLDNPLSTPYLFALERRGKRHTIWPPHCIVGTVGYDIHPTLRDALSRYIGEGRQFHVVHKGDCMFAEHFSALKAEVEFELFPETGLNTPLLDALKEYDRLYLAGECADICVKETLSDITKFAPQVASRMVILTNCMSALSKDFSFETDTVYRSAMAVGAGITSC